MFDYDKLKIEWNSVPNISNHPLFDFDNLYLFINRRQVQDFKIITGKDFKIALCKIDDYWTVPGDVMLNSTPIQASMDDLISVIEQLPENTLMEEVVFLKPRNTGIPYCFTYRENRTDLQGETFEDTINFSFDPKYRKFFREYTSEFSVIVNKQPPDSKLVDCYLNHLKEKELFADRHDNISLMEKVFYDMQWYLKLFKDEECVACLPFFNYDNILSGHQPYYLPSLGSSGPTILFIELAKFALRYQCAKTILLGSTIEVSPAYIWKSKFAKKSKNVVNSFMKKGKDTPDDFWPPFFTHENIFISST